MRGMNLEKLFETQKVLRERINYQGEDRFNKLVLALLVELGECANELPEVFKFWSNKKNNIEKALEEYVDGLHFLLELGIEIHDTNYEPKKLVSILPCDIASEFKAIYELASTLDFPMLLISPDDYRTLFNNYLHLGKVLGFTWGQVEQAYYDKNKINHVRQDEGY
jgi:dimeric dUTPase (all-alpha-NTP-PPase superfamily)